MYGSWFRVEGVGLRVWGKGFKVWGSGWRIEVEKIPATHLQSVASVEAGRDVWLSGQSEHSLEPFTAGLGLGGQKLRVPLSSGESTI